MKKYILALILIMPFSVLAFDTSYQELNDLVQQIKKVYNLMRILAPLGVVVMGIIDYTKVVIGDPDKDMSKANKRFINKLIAAAIVLLMFSIVDFIIGIVGNTANAQKWVECWNGNCVQFIK